MINKISVLEKDRFPNMPLTFPSTIYAYIDTYLDPHIVITTDPPPHASRCAQYVFTLGHKEIDQQMNLYDIVEFMLVIPAFLEDLNNTGIAKITVELEDK